MSGLICSETSQRRAVSDTASINCSSCKPKTACTLSESSLCTSCFGTSDTTKHSAQSGDAMRMFKTSEISFRRILFFFAESIKKWNTAGTDSDSLSKVSATHVRSWPNKEITVLKLYWVVDEPHRFNAFVELRPETVLRHHDHDHDQEKVEHNVRRRLNPRSCDFSTFPPICTSQPCCRPQSLAVPQTSFAPSPEGLVVGLHFPLIQALTPSLYLSIEGRALRAESQQERPRDGGPFQQPSRARLPPRPVTTAERL